MFWSYCNNLHLLPILSLTFSIFLGICDKHDSLVVCCTLFLLVCLSSCCLIIYLFFNFRLVTKVGMTPRTSWTIDWYTNYRTMGAAMRVSHIKYAIFLHCTICQFCFLSSELQIHVSENGICYFVKHAQFSPIVLPCFSLLVRWKKGGNLSF
jgi:hypothetical protein